MYSKIQALPRRQSQRKGLAIVEFSVVSSVFFLLIFAIVEFGRVAMVVNALGHAAQEGCRAGIVPGSTTADVANRVETTLESSLIRGAVATITPPEVAEATQGDSVTVHIEVPFAQVSWLPAPLYLGNTILEATATMVREAK